jgi:hypothetical protein
MDSNQLCSPHRDQIYSLTRHRHRPCGFAPGVAVVEQLVLDTLVVAAPDAERNHPVYILDDGADVVFDLAEGRIETHRHVATADVKADAGDRDLPFIGDHAADRLRISQMTIRADHAGHGIAGRHAVAHLRNRGVVVLAENLEWVVLILRCLWLDCDIGRNRLGFPREMLLAGGIPERAPGRHRPLSRTIDLRSGVEPGLTANALAHS